MAKLFRRAWNWQTKVSWQLDATWYSVVLTLRDAICIVQCLGIIANIVSYRKLTLNQYEDEIGM